MSSSEKKARASAPPDPEWEVTLSKKSLKNLIVATDTVREIVDLLREELAYEGPVQIEWPNYGQLKRQKGQKRDEKRYHCHLYKGRPTYVACWKVMGKSIEIEIYYVGVHGRAPY